MEPGRAGVGTLPCSSCQRAHASRTATASGVHAVTAQWHRANRSAAYCSAETAQWHRANRSAAAYCSRSGLLLTLDLPGILPLLPHLRLQDSPVSLPLQPLRPPPHSVRPSLHLHSRRA